ncbi:MAG: hypothetical protein JOZ32_08925 [Bryobacterales bacterium]|nr:hypothetical protein [Bryobacterales bacterium]
MQGPAQHVQKKNAQKASTRDLCSAKLVAPSADIESNINGEGKLEPGKNWKLVALSLVGKIDQLLRQLGN